MDVEILTGDSSEPIYPLPDYLYDDVFYNDVYYLLNKDVIFEDIKTVLEENVRGTVRPINKAYSWYEYHKESYSRESVLQQLSLPDIFSEVDQQEAVVLNETIRSVEKIKGFVQKYPQTTFQFFYSPYSMAYWYNRYAVGIFFKDVKNLEYSMKELLECENVKLYFPSNYEMITDLDCYKDLGHYNMEIQYQIFEDMKTEKNLLTKENYQDYIEEFRSSVLECDFEELFLSGS